MSFLSHLSWECVVSELRFGWRSLGYAPTWHCHSRVAFWKGHLTTVFRPESLPQLSSVEKLQTGQTLQSWKQRRHGDAGRPWGRFAWWKPSFLYVYICSLRISHIHTEMWSPHPHLPSPFLTIPPIPFSASLLFSVISLWIQLVLPVGARLWT